MKFDTLAEKKMLFRFYGKCYSTSAVLMWNEKSWSLAGHKRWTVQNSEMCIIVSVLWGGTRPDSRSARQWWYRGAISFISCVER